jgi:hypothetical protein
MPGKPEIENSRSTAVPTYEWPRPVQRQVWAIVVLLAPLARPTVYDITRNADRMPIYMTGTAAIRSAMLARVRPKA